MMPESQSGRSLPSKGLQAVCLMLELRVRRLRNRVYGVGQRDTPGVLARATTRTTEPERWLGPLMGGGVGLAALTAFGLFQGEILADAYARGVHGEVATAAAHLLVLLCTVTLLGFGLSNKDLNQLDGNMDWLLTLPASIPVLYSMKIGERTLLNMYGWLLVYPWMVGMISGGEWSWVTPIIAVAACLPLFLLLAVSHVVLESAARRWLPGRLMNALQLLGTLSGIGLVLGAQRLPAHMAFIAGLPWLPLTTLSELALAITDRQPSMLLHGARYAFEVTLWFTLGVFLLRGISRSGALVGRGARTGTHAGSGSAVKLPLGLSTAGMVEKELIRGVRDKKVLQLALVVPATLVFVIGILVTSAKGRVLAESPEHLPALAYGLGATIALTSLGSLLFAERQEVWLLFTVPRRLTAIVLQQALPWIPLGSIYASLLIGYGLTRQAPSLTLLGGTVYCYAGITLLSLLSAAFAAHSVDPNAMKEGDTSLRGSPQVLLMFSLGIAYSYGFYGGPQQQLSLVLLLGTVTWAAWQEAERRLPYLLEPELRPEPRISLLDALVSALLFFVLQTLAVHVVTSRLALAGWVAQLVAFIAAAVLVVAGAAFVFRSRGVPDMLARLGLVRGVGHGSTIVAGVVFALPAVGVALGFVTAVSHLPWLSEWTRAAAAQRPRLEGPGAGLALVLLSLVAAPLCEELIFRGLVFRALRQSFKLPASALLASLIFAAMHPGVAALPVFVMSVCAALAFERSQSLASAVIVHAAYNATLMAASLL